MTALTFLALQRDSGQIIDSERSTGKDCWSHHTALDAILDRHDLDQVKIMILKATPTAAPTPPAEPEQAPKASDLDDDIPF